MTSPVAVKREPWHGQSQVLSARSTPRCNPCAGKSERGRFVFRAHRGVDGALLAFEFQNIARSSAQAFERLGRTKPILDEVGEKILVLTHVIQKAGDGLAIRCE